MKDDRSFFFCNGEWKQGGGEAFCTTGPWGDNLPATYRFCSPEQVQEAGRAAKRAWESWRRQPPGFRESLCLRFAGILSRRSGDLARCIREETGKPLWEAEAEVASMVGKVALSIEAQRSRCAGYQKGHSVTRYTSLGVCAVLGPYNFPGHLPNGHIVPALLAGNTLLFKPSEFTAQTAALSIECWTEAGLPPGVLNLVPGGAAVGRVLLEVPELAAVFFTGSASAGTAIHKCFGGRPEVLLALEMGGNNPLVVWDWTDPDVVVWTILQSAFITAGQRCTCARRLILPDTSEGESILARLLSAMERIRISQYRGDDEAFCGPVIHHGAAVRLLRAQDSLIQAGAKPVLPMRLLRGGTGLLSPGILDVSGIKIPDEEWFGPLLLLQKARDFSDALAMANQTRYGLAAGLVSNRRALYNIFLQSVRAGIVNWNVPLTGASSAAPFGGFGLSGNHRPSAFFAADYCNQPMTGMEQEEPQWPQALPPGFSRGQDFYHKDNL